MRRAITDESLGMRLHEVNRQRAVDRAIERMRYGLRADWHYLTTDDHANLRWIIGELWVTTPRDEWDGLHFSKLDLENTQRLVGAGDRLRRHGTSRMGTLAAVAALIRAASDGSPEPVSLQASLAY